MKAIRIYQTGGHEVLRYEDVPIPEPKQGEVRVKVAASGVNFIDIYQRTGQYQLPLPFTPGQEAAGMVDAVGAEVMDFKVGDRVAYAGPLGAYAEYAVVPAARLVTVPSGCELNTAAAVMLQGMTAHYLTHSSFPLQQGHTVLIHAAAGGTGLLLVQMAKRLGARVIGTVSTEEKAQLAKQVGADEVILYTKTDFAVEVRRLTDGKGVEVVYDSVGKTTFDQSLDCLRPRGYLVLFGQSSGAVSPVNPQILNAKGSLFLTRPTMGHYIATRGELVQRSSDLFNWIVAGELRVRIDQTFALSNVASAHQYMEGRETKGKVVLIP